MAAIHETHLRDMEEDKGSIKQLEGYAPKEVDIAGAHLQVQMPAELAALSPEELADVDKKATKKLDILLMPILVALYILNYLDRQNIASAKIAGIQKDLNLSAQDYSTAVALLFAGYIGLQIPSNMVASKIKYPGIYICFMCAAWGLVSGLTGAVQNFVGLAVCRVFLGFTEAAFFPGAVFLLSMFYEKRQMAFRTAILYCGSQIGNAFGGLFALAILELDGTSGLEGWRWLFIVEGAMTVGFAAIFVWIIPNTPKNIRWLTPLEKQQLLYRLECDRGTKDNTSEVSAWQGLVLCVKDVKVWMMCACLSCNYIAASVTNFFPIVVAGLGFNRTTTLAITAPPYLLCSVVLLLNGWHSDKTKERYLHIICPFFLTMIGNAIAVATTNTAARYFAMMILPMSFYAPSIVILSWISSTITGPNVKRAVAYALINSLANTPNIWTSYLYGNNAPRFVLAFSVDLAAAAAVVLFGTITYLYLKRQNAKLDRGEDTGKHGPSEVQVAAGFRYQL